MVWVVIVLAVLHCRDSAEFFGKLLITTSLVSRVVDSHDPSLIMVFYICLLSI